MDFPILTVLVALPLVAGLACLFAGANAARWIALIATLVELVLGIMLWAGYEPGGPQWQFTEYLPLAGGPACEAVRCRERARTSGFQAQSARSLARPVS